MPNRCFGFLTSMVASLALVSGSRADEPKPPALDFDVTLRPVRRGGPEVTAIEVRTVLRGASFEGEKRFAIKAPIVYAGVTGIADRIRDLEVRDASGLVPLDTQDDPANPSGFPFFRNWRAKRAVVPPVDVTYRSLPQPTPPVMGPQFFFRAHDGGLSTAGSGFLAVPWGLDPASIRVKWDLSDLAPGSLAASTFGEGDFEIKGPPELLTQGFFLAGPIGRFVAEKPPGSFAAYWLGTPPFDPRAVMAWTSEAYAYQRRFFGEETRPAYRVFVRSLVGLGQAVGGTALGDSFLLATGPGRGDPSVAGPKATIAHEILHRFIGDLKGEDGGPWFEEGLTEYYTHLFLLRSGLETVDDYLKSVNGAAAAYYQNPYRNASAAELARLGFSKGVGAASPQNVPYVRGRLYFALVDARIRAASKGKRRLDDVILSLFEKRRRGERLDVPTLVAALEREYGPEARTDFRAVNVLGETVVPPPGAFGVGFERHARTFKVQGKDVDGYEWVRVPSVPDERCREW
jgi:M61 glycyl aminopeptidase